MGRNQASTRHVRHVEKGQMLVSTREPRVEALSQVGHLSMYRQDALYAALLALVDAFEREAATAGGCGQLLCRWQLHDLRYPLLLV